MTLCKLITLCHCQRVLEIQGPELPTIDIPLTQGIMPSYYTVSPKDESKPPKFPIRRFHLKSYIPDGLGGRIALYYEDSTELISTQYEESSKVNGHS